jgi:hypothetical protein
MTKMFLRILVLLAFLDISACSWMHAPTTANIPIAVPCKAPPGIARPHLQISDLKDGDGADVVMKSYVATVETLKGYSIYLETLLNGYRK